MRVPHSNRQIDTSHYLLVGLVLLVLTLPLALQEGITTPTPHRANMEVGFTPGSGGWSYLTGASRSEPPAEKSTVFLIGPGAFWTAAVVLYLGWLMRPRVRHSVSYRRQYLVPIFNSTYT